jgi:hypothetical protein
VVCCRMLELWGQALSPAECLHNQACWHLEAGRWSYSCPLCLLCAEAPEVFGGPKAAKERFVVRASLIRSRATIRRPRR